MKPTPQQVEIIKCLKIEMTHWQNTNDIRSPTHDSDLTAELSKFEYDFGMSEEDWKDIHKHLWQIFLIIRKYP